MTALAERILAANDRYHLFPAGSAAAVAVSGGRDSICLLHALTALASQLGVSVAAFHIDHQARGEESDADARFVQQIAAEWRIPCFVAAAPVPPGENFEQAARRERYAALRSLAREHGCARVATAHHQADQAETVLYRILRGAGAAGLAGIRPTLGHLFVRPLLHAPAHQIDEYVRFHQLPFRQDSSNNDLSFVRNRLRHRLMPQLREAVNPGLDQALAHLAEIAADEMDYWDALAADFPARVWGDGLVFRASAFASLPRAVSRHVVRSLVRRVKGSLRGWEFDHTEAIRALAARMEGDGRWHGAGVEFFRSFDEILVRPWPALPDSARMFQIGATVPGRYRIPGGPEVVLNPIQVLDPGAKPGESADWLPKEVLDRPLVLRTWTPGDTISLPGAGPKRLKVLFQDARVPIWERRSWPVLESAGQILWTQRFGVADLLAIDVLRTEVRDRQEAIGLEIRVVPAAGSSPFGKKKR